MRVLAVFTSVLLLGLQSCSGSADRSDVQLSERELMSLGRCLSPGALENDPICANEKLREVEETYYRAGFRFLKIQSFSEEFSE